MTSTKLVAYGRKRRSAICGLLAGLTGLVVAGQVAASPWAEVGDATLRSDIEVLAAYRLTPGLVTTWPLPWMQLASLSAIDQNLQLPAYVRTSLQRVQRQAKASSRLHRPNFAIDLRATNEPSVVRDFGSTAREDVDVRVSAEYLWRSTAARLSVGYLDDGHFTRDDTYLAQRIGNMVAYGGYLNHWWGPGWDGSLIMSNNARPFPSVGLMRLQPNAFDLPVLRYLGPWQFNSFLGMLEESGRVVDSPLVAGLRLAVNPLPGLELGASRTFMICGKGRPCGASTWRDALLGRDNSGDADDPSNQLGGIDIRYTARLGAHHGTVYYQTVGEDEADFMPSKRGGLIGVSVGGPLKDQGAQWRLTGEFADTTASSAIGLGQSDPQINVFYNHATYRSGYRYRDRAIGHSLDGDSRLYSLTASLTDLKNRTYKLRYYRAEINRDGTGIQEVSQSAEDINLLVAGVIVPSRYGTIEAQVRLQDDQPDTPGESDAEVAAELRWLYRF